MRTRRLPGDGSVFLRASDHRWVAQLSVGSRTNRRLYRRYATSKPEAERLRRELRSHAAELAAAPIATTTGDYLRSWLDDSAKRTVRPTTFHGYDVVVRRHLVPALGAIPLHAITPADVDHLLNALSQRLAPKSVHNVLVVLRRALNVAVRRGLISRNPASLVDPPRVPRADRAALEVGAVRRLLASVRDEPLYALYLVALATGARQGELLGLRWVDVDLDRASIHITYQLARLDGEYQLVEPKTLGSRRTVALPPVVVVALRDLHSQQTSERAADGGATEEGLVFLSRTGRPISSSWLSHHFANVAKAAELPDGFVFHDLRRTHASVLVGLGVHPKVVSERLGHAHVAMSMDVYARTGSEQDREAARVLDAVFREP